MDIPFLTTLLFLGLGGGFLSGLLGLGGAIFMIPLLLYVPPLLGVGLLDMKQEHQESEVRYRGNYCNNRSEDVVSDTYGALG